MLRSRWFRRAGLAGLVVAGAIFALQPAGSQTGGVPKVGKGSGKLALPALRAQANEILDGGPRAFEARLASLRGAPVVVNQWASWCGPCRYEFPFFQHLARRYGNRVGFLGVDSKDARPSARKFLREFPV